MFTEVKAQERAEGVCAEGVCPVSPIDVAGQGRGSAGVAGSPLPCWPAVPREPCAGWTMYQVDSHPLLPGWPDSLQRPQAFHQPGLPFSPAHPELLPHPQPGSSVAWAPESLRLSSSAAGLGLSTREGTVLEWDGVDSVTEEPKEVVLSWTAFPRPHLPTDGGARLGTQVRRGAAPRSLLLRVQLRKGMLGRRSSLSLW